MPLSIHISHLAVGEAKSEQRSHTGGLRCRLPLRVLMPSLDGPLLWYRICVRHGSCARIADGWRRNYLELQDWSTLPLGLSLLCQPRDGLGRQRIEQSEQATAPYVSRCSEAGYR